MEKIIHVHVPFTQLGYNAQDKAGRIELIKGLARQASSHVPAFDWDDLRQRFEQSPQEISFCGHEIQTLKIVLDCDARLAEKDRELEILRAGMADLCEEMERVRTENQTYLMGPGESGKL